MKPLLFLLAGGGAFALAALEVMARSSDGIGVLMRIRRLLGFGPDQGTDMSAAMYWLELAILIPIGVLFIIAFLVAMGF